MDHLCCLCLVIVMLSRLFIAALWSPAWKGLTSWLLFVMSNCDFVTFSCGILGQVWYFIRLIPDLCRLSYLKNTCISVPKVIFLFVLFNYLFTNVNIVFLFLSARGWNIAI